MKYNEEKRPITANTKINKTASISPPVESDRSKSIGLYMLNICLIVNKKGERYNILRLRYLNCCLCLFTQVH